MNRSRFSDVTVADINGDGRSDVLRMDGAALDVSWGAKTRWERRATLPYRSGEVLLADFNGDGADDVFHGTGR